MTEARQALETIIFRHPATAHFRATDSALLSLATERASDPTAFEDFPPVFFSAEISSERIDSYFTRMAESSLRNYAQDAANGVSLQDSHLTRQLGLGRSLTGAFVAGSGEAVARVVADFFTIKGLADTDAFIARLRTGIASDVSIGFYGGAFICNICGLDMLTDWDCWHYPGFEYDVATGQPEEDATEKKVCVADVIDARLAEVSPVYKGSTPGAAIIKAERLLVSGRLKPETARLLLATYRNFGSSIPESLRLHASDSRSPAPRPNDRERPTEDPPMTTEARSAETTAAIETLLASIRGQLTEAGLTETTIASPEEGARALVAEIQRLRPLADAGTRFKNEVIDAAIASGVRAFGSTGDSAFKVEENKAMFASLPIDTIRSMGESWEEIAKAKTPAGRATRDDARAPGEQETVPVSTSSVVLDQMFAS